MLRFVAALLLVVISILAVVAALVSADMPVDMPCITWKAWNSNEYTPNPAEMFVVSNNAWVMEYGPQECSVQGTIIPCWSTDSGYINTFGHHDYQADYIPMDSCRIFSNQSGVPSVYMSNNFLLPFRGPKYDTYKKVLTQTGAPVPDDAIRVGNRVMAISTSTANGQCAGIGFAGWVPVVEQDDGTEVFGDVHFSIVNSPFTTQSFQIAVCKAYTNPPMTTTTVLPPPTTTFAPNSKPYIRFAHTIPVTTTLTATITQGSVSYTWSNYSFGQFSNWNQLFSVGNGIINISHPSTGEVYWSQSIYLSPGPLVVVVKGFWPGTTPASQWQFAVEGIAASYVPPTNGMSGVRLVNLAPDVVAAGLDGNGKKLVDGVKFTTSSIWAPITSDAQMTFSAQDDISGKTLTSVQFQAPNGPMVFSTFLIGLSNATSGSVFAPRIVPLLDAPEF